LSQVITFSSIDELREKLESIELSKGDWAKITFEMDLLYPAEIVITKEWVEDRVIEALGRDKIKQYGFTEKSFMIFVTDKGLVPGPSGPAVYRLWHVYVEWVIEADPPSALLFLVVLFAGIIATLTALYFVVQGFKGVIEVIRKTITEIPSELYEFLKYLGIASLAGVALGATIYISRKSKK
jgi:hypothetical protein